MYDLAQLVVEHAAVLRAEVVGQLRYLRLRETDHRAQWPREHRHELGFCWTNKIMLKTDVVV